MGKIGVLSFSDGRKRVHDGLAPYIKETEERLIRVLEAGGEFETVVGKETIWNAGLAGSEGERLRAAGVDAVVLNVPVFAFPNFALLAARACGRPCAAAAPVNGKLPGLGGLLAAVNMLRQNGVRCEKIWGNPEDAAAAGKLFVFCRAARAVSRLEGSVYGLFGGRSIGMGTGAANPDLWFKVFGVDTEHVDQLEIVRRAALVEPGEVESAFDWVVTRVGKILYDGDKLTEETLKFQIACCIALKTLVRERNLDFIGVKCHYELSEHQVTQCVAADFMNDPYDWDGPKEPVVCACEADSDGALTMQIMKLVSGKPVMFVDFRHFDSRDGVFAFCNCGSFASWYAARSDEPEKNLAAVTYHPLIKKYAGKGCHVQFVAREGEMTFGRLTRAEGSYKLTIFRGRIEAFPPEKANETCPEWPHAFVRVRCDPLELIDKYENNHVHGIAGDYAAELVKVCELLGIESEVLA